MSLSFNQADPAASPELNAKPAPIFVPESPMETVLLEQIQLLRQMLNDCTQRANDPNFSPEVKQEALKLAQKASKQLVDYLQVLTKIRHEQLKYIIAKEAKEDVDNDPLSLKPRRKVAQ